MTKNSAFAQAITEARRQSGYTLRELSMRSAHPHSAISNYEQNRRIPGAEVAVRLTRALGLRKGTASWAVIMAAWSEQFTQQALQRHGGI